MSAPSADLLNRLSSRPDGKYIVVTAITPTPLGEGKSTTTIGLTQGMGKRRQNVIAAIRQPSGGPTMNIKGSAAGGGLSQCIPLTPFSLGLTGDINAIMNAHNLAMVALTSRMQHEFNYDDEQLAKRKLRRLDIDPRNIEMKWIMDFCAQSLRDIIIGLGRKDDGFMMRSGFAIAVSSEIMAILAVARDLADMRERMGRIVVAYDKSGKPVTTGDLDVAGAMAAWMVDALNPNLMQTIEGQPVFVHAGPFANIAIGQSSIIADRIGLKLGDYVVTEAGFASELGAEKFFDIKSQIGNLKTNAVVIVATVKASKYHGGAKLSMLHNEDIDLLKKGFDNLDKHIENMKYFGFNPIIAVNRFDSDTDAELDLLEKHCKSQNVKVTINESWARGGEGAVELANKVIETISDCSDCFKPLYDPSWSFEEKIETICKKMYGADHVEYALKAKSQLDKIEKLGLGNLAVCIAKTQKSLSDDQNKRGRPQGFTIKIREVQLSSGAGFIVPIAGNIMRMPGLPVSPSAEKIDIDGDGRISGLF